MPTYRFETFLWGMSCLGVWVLMARDIPSALVCAVITGVPTLFFVHLIHIDPRVSRSSTESN